MSTQKCFLQLHLLLRLLTAKTNSNQEEWIALNDLRKEIICCFRILPFRGEKQFKPLPQGKILVPLKASFQNFLKAPLCRIIWFIARDYQRLLVLEFSNFKSQQSSSSVKEPLDRKLVFPLHPQTGKRFQVGTLAINANRNRIGTDLRYQFVSFPLRFLGTIVLVEVFILRQQTAEWCRLQVTRTSPKVSGNSKQVQHNQDTSAPLPIAIARVSYACTQGG